ncbi:DUF4826 family protein [Reinekea marinisedimentorum]|uniref:Uncharacterized protein DUF4826 n=1 Tax=Reinekea marinisedimentorum TaxID=230495 RepID=A0A4R3HTP2_9GAMM|nr:DUF4826 family protein [Reinekea marinisedimentorum]TCS36452.1 uncharacterized protein DUF4826 [Reinekea marinisedimentorum]
MNSNSSLKTDYNNRFNRRVWLNDRRSDLILYLQSRGIQHLPVIAEPHWSVIPRSSIWIIQPSASSQPGGWYGIAGDHPTDIVAVNGVSRNPRDILTHFTQKWLAAAETLMNGEDCREFRIKDADQRETIGELIHDRASRIQRWTEDDYLWIGSNFEFSTGSGLKNIDPFA